MRRLSPRISIVLLTILLVSAFTVCPVIANESLDKHSYAPPLGCLVDENDNFYVFTTHEGKECIIHERGEHIHEIAIDDQYAVLLKDTPLQSLVATSGDYLLIFDKIRNIVDVFQPPSLDGGIDLPIISIDNRNTSIEQDFSPAILPEYFQIVEAGLLVGLSCVYPVLGAGYFASTYLMEKTKAIVFAAVPAAVTADIVLKITGGVVIGAVLYDVLVKVCIPDSSGYRYFVVQQNGFFSTHYYKFRYQGSDKKGTAEYIGEVDVIDGVFTNLGDDMIEVNGNMVKTVDEWKYEFASFLKKLYWFFENLAKEIAKFIAKWAIAQHYVVFDIKDIQKTAHLITYEQAVEYLKKCKDDEIFIKGISDGDCYDLTQQASDGLRPELHEKDKKGKLKHQYPHYHPVDKYGQKCKPHCFWDWDEKKKADL